MRILNVVILLAALLTAVQAGEYCDNFEPSGDFGSFWRQISEDSNGKWEPTSYKEISKNITYFPAPASGDTVLYLTAPGPGRTASARMETVSSFRFPNGSSIYFRYWLHSKYVGAATFYVALALKTEEGHRILNLSSTSSPDNTDWTEASASIDVDVNQDQEYQIMIFANNGGNPEDNTALDDIIISGPDNLPDRDCEPSTTTTETTTTEQTTTTTKPTTTTAEPTTTTTEPTTTAPTTTETTTTEPTTVPSTSSEPSSSPVPTTLEPTTTDPPPAPTTEPAPIDDRRYGSSALLWVVFAVLGTSVVLLLVLVLARRQRWRDDQLALVQHHGTSGSSDSGGWYDYVTNDPWTRLSGWAKRL